LNGTPRRSLFWTIAGLLLAVGIAGTLLQILVATAVFEPLEQRESRSRTDLMAANVSAEIVAASLQGGPIPDTTLLRERRQFGAGAPWIVYRTVSGEVISDPPGRERFLGGLLDGTNRPGATTDTLGRPVAFTHIDILARRPVMRGGTRLGEVVLARPYLPRREVGVVSRLTSFLFIPIAFVLSLVTALVLVRLLVRRLRAIEMLAARVAEGDLSVRIQDTSGDEIGAIAERLDRMTARLAEARTRIAQNEDQRRQLFADITHELATPLTSIRGNAETLLDTGVRLTDEERAHFVRGVLEEAQRLDRAIRDLFELARLEAGATELQRERLDWVALCRHTAERFAPRFQEAHLRLQWHPATSEAWIYADGRRMEQVLENLLVNALRYVPPDGTVEMSLAPTNGSGNGFQLEVRDDGPGVSPEELPHVFERFYRSASARGGGKARDGGGSGLGLAIVREIVERHGGRVSASTGHPRGLSIQVELPDEQTSRTARSTSAVRPPSGGGR